MGDDSQGDHQGSADGLWAVSPLQELMENLSASMEHWNAS
jgi:hypothetical protein